MQKEKLYTKLITSHQTLRMPCSVFVIIPSLHPMDELTGSLRVHRWSKWPLPWCGRCRAGGCNTGGPPLPQLRAPWQKNSITLVSNNFQASNNLIVFSCSRKFRSKRLSSGVNLGGINGYVFYIYTLMVKKLNWQERPDWVNLELCKHELDSTRGKLDILGLRRPLGL